MKLQMVHDRTATSVTRVLGVVAVLRCGNQMEKLPHCYFSWIVSFQNRKKCETYPLGKKESKVNCTPIRISGVGLEMFLEEISHGRIYSKKNGRQVDGRTDRQAGGKADGQTDHKTDEQTDGQTDRRADRHTDKQTER
jgi:hypothetical protein